jgi:acetyl esterase/lipase
MHVSSRLPAGILVAGMVAASIVGALTSHAAVIPSRTTPEGASANVSAYPGVRVLRNVPYEVVDGTTEQLDVCLPARLSKSVPRPAVIEVHGGSWAHKDKSDPAWQDVCRWLASVGYVTANVDYRLAPLHPYPAGIRDVERAVEWMRQPAQTRRFDINPRRIAAFGGSAGGNLVSLLGTLGSGSTSVGHRVAAVVDMSGPIDLTSSGVERRTFYPLVLAYLHCTNLGSCPQAAAASPDHHVDSTDPPFFITNSTDELIPYAQSVNFVKTLRSSGVKATLVTLPGRAHSIAGLNVTMRSRIAAFLHTAVPLPGRRGPSR